MISNQKSSAYEVTYEVIRRMQSGKYDVIILNFANMDMVGHTGIFEAAVKAVEAVDNCIGRIIVALKETGWVALITADHGNAEQIDKPENRRTIYCTYFKSGKMQLRQEMMR